MELGPHDIRVNALLPGIVEGERIRRVIAARADAQGVSYDEMERRYLGQVSLRRMVTPADVAAMVAVPLLAGRLAISADSRWVCAAMSSPCDNLGPFNRSLTHSQHLEPSMPRLTGAQFLADSLHA